LSITIQHTQESLCLAHIYAVAGMAGANYIIKSVYDYGVDGQFVPVTSRNGRRVSTGHPLDFQAKSSINWQMSGGNVVYDLEAKTYDDIVTRDVSETTLLLILLCLPRSPEEWHGATGSETIIRHCCYWKILEGDPCGRTSTMRISIPATNILTPAALRQLLADERTRRMSMFR
jgi:hypothetical protein